MQVGIFNNERITIKTMVSFYQNMKLHFTLVFKLLSSNCSFLEITIFKPEADVFLKSEGFFAETIEQHSLDISFKQNKV